MTEATAKPRSRRKGLIAATLIIIAAVAGILVYVVVIRPSTGSCNQTIVSLGSAANFAVLAGSTITNAGPTNVTGDVGLSPGGTWTGFPPGRVLVGNTHISDTVAATAQADSATAYNDALGRTKCSSTVSGNIGGQTLTPGIYKSASSLSISSGDLTLDAKGNSSAVFVFQVTSTFATSSGRQVILAGGAQAKNIFWQVGNSATLGATSVLYGTILAYGQVTFTTGATLNGRALAQIGAVTLDTNTITKPA
jgi:hypothetical protein